MTPPVPKRGPLTSIQADKFGVAQASLRVLVTTDVHMHLTGFDYVADAPTCQNGLAGLGTLIEQARSAGQNEGRVCILLDNGDMFQGTPLGDYAARQTVSREHPAIASLNHLGYDALGVGNHDLDFGLPYLQDVAAHLDAPVICSNMLGLGDANGTVPHRIHRSVVLECPLPDTAHNLRVGVVSVLPKQTEVWNRHWLQGHAQILPAPKALPAIIADLRAQGADLVVLLAHMGIVAEDGIDPETALSLAGTMDVDAVVTGHTHRRFPGNDHSGEGDVDTAQGRLCGVPAVMAGHGASDLGVIDLNLEKDAAGEWQVTDHTTTLLSNTRVTPALPALHKTTNLAHETLRQELNTPMGWTDHHLHNYFSLAAPTSTCALIARAKMRLVRDAIASTADAHLPVVASTAAYTAGGRDGPDHYLSIPPGTVLRRHLAGLNPYNNQTVVLRVTGRALRTWLEHAALVFSTLADAPVAGLLKRPQSPSFNFETVYGVTYTIDPTQMPGSRVGNLRLNGTPVTTKQRLLLATNQFRAAGGGGYKVFAADRAVMRLSGNTENNLARTLAETTAQSDQPEVPWRFDTPSPVKAELHTAPEAAAFLNDIAHLTPQMLGQTETGFLRVGLTL